MSSSRVFGLGETPTARVVRVGIGIAVILVVFQTAAHLTYAFVSDGRWGELNLDAEYGTFSWISSGTTFAAGFVALLLALFDPRRARRYLLLAAMLAFFSLDDAVELHERLGEAAIARLVDLDRGSFNHIFWPILFFPLLALAFLLLWDVSRYAGGQVRALLRAGMTLLVVGVAAEALASAWYLPGGDPDTWPGAVQIMIEENAELAGWIVIVTALTAEACRELLSGVGQGEARDREAIDVGRRRPDVASKSLRASRYARRSLLT
jgi:hypothetical protein